MNITYSECVLVTLVIQHAFIHINTWQEFRKKKQLLKIKCVIFFTTLKRSSF